MTGYLYFSMDPKIRKKIISEYKKGKGSTTIMRELGVAKEKILQILNQENLIRKRDRCQRLDINFDGEKYFINRNCPRCNEKIKTTSKDRTICCRNYINAKNSNCKKCSLKLQVGKGNPFYGKKHTKESLKKISKSRKGKGLGEKNSMSNPIWRKKAGDNLKKKWNSGSLEKTRKIMSEHMKKTIRLGKIKSNISSKKEIEIIRIIKKMGFEVKHSYRVDTKICDVYIPKLNLIIEYFGDYWHCNPEKYDADYFNKKKSLTAKQIWDYDKNKIDLIRNFGYNLEVIWESELKNDNKKINQIIEKYVKSN